MGKFRASHAEQACGKVRRAHCRYRARDIRTGHRDIGEMHLEKRATDIEIKDKKHRDRFKIKT